MKSINERRYFFAYVSEDMEQANPFFGNHKTCKHKQYRYRHPLKMRANGRTQTTRQDLARNLIKFC
jgi:hypothetical protein